MKKSFSLILWICCTSVIGIFGQSSSNYDICDEESYSSQTGTLSSPNFPNQPTRRVNCTVTIDATSGYVLRITFIEFEISNSPCSRDYVMISDGKEVEKKLCGLTIPNEIITTTRVVRITFVSSLASRRAVFRLHWQRTPLGDQNSKLCGSESYTASSGALTSPLYPSQLYPNGMHCIWTIAAPRGSRIRLRFETLELEKSDRCEYDYLAVYDGKNEQTYCGTELPADFISGTSTVRIIFFSDSSQRFEGFRLSWERVSAVCSNLPSTRNGNVNCSDDNRVGSSCYHNCLENYELVGENSPSVCILQNDGTTKWTSQFRRCIVRCPIIDLENGSSECSKRYSIGSTCHYQCNDNFYLVGASSSSCESKTSFEAVWTPTLPTCLGPPIPSKEIVYHVLPRRNRATFQCMFDGYPLPEIEWRFANGSELPKTSQFQVRQQRTVSNYRTSRGFVVYGMSCKEASLMRFRCFASNIHTRTPVQSDVFIPNIDTLALRFHRTQLSCQEAHSYCAERGTSLAVLPSQSMLESINQNAPSYYWVSLETQDYIDGWPRGQERPPTNPDGCIRVQTIKNAWSFNQVSRSGVLCEKLPGPLPSNVNAKPNTCYGSIMNISWQMARGANNVQHQVFLSNRQSIMVKPNVFSILLNDLIPETRYEIQVYSVFVGCSSSLSNSNYSISTGRKKIGAVRSINVKHNEANNVCLVLWSHTQIKNKVQTIEDYLIRVTEKPALQRTGSIEIQPTVQTFSVKSSQFEYTISSLKANTEYDVRIGAVPSYPCNNILPTAWSKSIQGLCVTKSSVPDSVPLSQTKPYVKNGQIVLTLAPVDERKGLLSCYLVVIQKASNSNSFQKEDFQNLVQAGSSLEEGQAFIAYATSRIDSNTEITLGNNNQTCCDLKSIKSQTICPTSFNGRNRRALSSLVRAQNRPLKDGDNFSYYIIAAVPSGNSTLFTASATSTPFQTPRAVIVPRASQENPSNGATTSSNDVEAKKPEGIDWYIYVAAGVGGLILIFIIITVVVCKRKRSKQNFSTARNKLASPTVDKAMFSSKKNGLATSMVDLTVAIPGATDGDYCVPIVQFTSKQFEGFTIPKSSLYSTYLLKRRSGDQALKKEFKKVLPDLVNISTKYAKQSSFKDKNRSMDSLPSDKARVILDNGSLKNNNDYINAAFIDGFTTHRAYIAAQGPNKNTLNDFWKMIVENHCSKIVMLTRLRENSTVKCEPYWPGEGEAKVFGNVTVTTNSIINVGHYKRREFLVQVSHSPEHFVVTQFQFIKWADHDVPITTSSLLRFKKAILSQPTDGKILVHGSAGGGRTGTFLALLNLSEQLERCNEVNFIEAIKKLREARSGMVENLQQYIFLHKLICEIAYFHSTDSSALDFAQYINKMKQVNDSHVTYMKTQYEDLETIMSLHDEPELAANQKVDEPVHAYKRITADIAQLGVKEKKLIRSLDASIVESYHADTYFLTSQTPTDSKYLAFWKCVVEFRVGCVVQIEEEHRDLDDQCFGKPAGCIGDDLHVSIVKIEHRFGYTEKTLSITTPDLPAPLSVQLIELTLWSPFAAPESSITTLALRIKNYKTVSNQSGLNKYLAMICCSDGSIRSGAFCAIFNLLERLDKENKVDVFRTVKDLRDCRPLMAGNIQQYEFIYQAINQYIDTFNPYQEMN